MRWRVLLADEAERNREEAFLYYAARSPQGAVSWLEGYDQAIALLREQPSVFPRAREADRLKSDIREIAFGAHHSRLTHRLLFTIEKIPFAY
jgi:plasmid stabilization system protein ParE